MKLRKGDKVKIISGKDKGKVGTVLKSLSSKNQIVVEGVNIARKHVKPGTLSKEGGIVSIERPINVSNAMFWDDKANDVVRIGYKLMDGKKYRVSKESGEILDKKI